VTVVEASGRRPRTFKRESPPDGRSKLNSSVDRAVLSEQLENGADKYRDPLPPPQPHDNIRDEDSTWRASASY
jgi:hypothetical protein